MTPDADGFYRVTYLTGCVKLEPVICQILSGDVVERKWWGGKKTRREFHVISRYATIGPFPSEGEARIAIHAIGGVLATQNQNIQTQKNDSRD
jgi:hypothetical protein